MSGWLKRAIWGVAAAISLTAPQAGAVLQPTPGGVTVPIINTGVTTCSNNNVEICLDQAEGDPNDIDAQKDALIAPETFQPTCQLTFTPIVKGGIIADIFGWYNVVADPTDATKFLAPPLTEMY